MFKAHDEADGRWSDELPRVTSQGELVDEDDPLAVMPVRRAVARRDKCQALSRPAWVTGVILCQP